MKRTWIAGAIGLILLTVSWVEWTTGVQAKPANTVNWIWFDEGNPLKEAPAESRYFRKVLVLKQSLDKATLDITADNQFTVWINGSEIGSGNDWKQVYHFDVKINLVPGENVIAVKATNQGGPAGLMVGLDYVQIGQSRTVLASDGSWKASKMEATGWENHKFDDSQWTPAKVLGPVGQTGPWHNPAWGAAGKDRFTVPPGFRVEMVAKNPKPGDPFSLVNMTFDNRGRLLVSQENGPILLCTGPNKDGVFETVKPYCEQVKNCQGMCWVKDALLLVGNGPKGTGLYRVRDSKGSDHTDEVQLVLQVAGSMGDHGPHAILHGPDDFLYVVVGNHSWAKPDKLADNSPLTRWPKGTMGPDQGKPGTTEDVLLPRLNDAHGHAANILAPGGTIWRLDQKGQHFGLVAAGFRNAYDAAFSPAAELFTFDSDMEWDVGLPWYRAVRVCHCPPGADFLWRTGAANTPPYYIDSLPPLYDTGRGSPVGLEFYDHNVFPEKYRGAYFMADWSLGLIWVVYLKPDGASYKATVEHFCTGNPMNVTDLAVGPDGALYFTMGGRSSPGGVYRIVSTATPGPGPGPEPTMTQVLLGQPQPLAAWSRADIAKAWDFMGKETAAKELIGVAQDPARTANERIKALTLVQNYGPVPDVHLLSALCRDKEADVRAQAVWLLGVNEYKEGREALVSALKDENAFVRRRACEALIRAGIEPPVEAILPLLAEKDRFLSTAARLVLQRIDPKLWTDRLWNMDSDVTAWQGIVALCKTNQAETYAGRIFQRLNKVPSGGDVDALLDFLRTVQLALVHATPPPGGVKEIAERCHEMFPHKDWRVNRELAILLTYFRMKGLLDAPVHAELLKALLNSKDDQAQQIDYFYCLRLLHEGWTPEQKVQLLTWYDSTKAWTGGFSFTPFLENILRDLKEVFTPQDLDQVLARGNDLPLVAAALLKMSAPEQLPSTDALADLYLRISKASTSQPNDLKAAVITALGQSSSPQAQSALRKIADKDPGQGDVVARSLARFPSAENWPYLVRGLNSSNPLVLFDLIGALLKSDVKPKPDEAAPFRALLLAARRLDVKNRWKVVQLLRKWSSNKQFGAEEGEWEPELAAWSRWFVQTFPKEPALPNVAAGMTSASKYTFDELLTFLEKDPAGRKGDPARGRLVFEKALCLKCHKFGKEGAGIGPELTDVSKRFNRQYILESIIYPSKVISDQYRSTTILTKKGQQITGLAAPQGDEVAVTLSDATKVTVPRADIDQQYTSLVSVMPEKVLDPLTKQEIADLFAFLEAVPAK